MKILVLRLTTILGMVMFCMMPMANAAGPGGGGGAPGGGGMSCGYLAKSSPCKSGGSSTTCLPSIGGEATCTLTNCDGTTIPLVGPLSGC